MANHSLINPTLTSGQIGRLFAVAKNRLDRPAALLALHHGGQVKPLVVADQVVIVAVTVSGHDQPEMAIPGRKDGQGPGSQAQASTPLQFQPNHGPPVVCPARRRLFSGRGYRARSTPDGSIFW